MLYARHVVPLNYCFPCDNKRRQEQEAGLVGDPAQLRAAVEARLFILSLAQVSLEPGGYAPQREPRSVQ